MELNKFSQRLKELMEEYGISRKDLSLQVGIDRKCVRLWISGKNFPKYTTLIKLAKYFHVRIDYLVGIEDDIMSAESECEIFDSIEEVSSKFSAALKMYMNEKGLTVYAMAKKLRIDQKALKKWLVVGSMPETAILIRLSKLMNISIHKMLGLEK